MSVFIRRYRPTDLECLIAMDDLSIIGGEGIETWVATDKHGLPLGYITVALEEVPRIIRVCVRKDYRRLTIGTQLADAAKLRYTRSHEPLDSVISEDDEVSRDFLKANGFEFSAIASVPVASGPVYWEYRFHSQLYGRNRIAKFLAM